MAADVKTKALGQIAAGATDAGHVCIFLQNFGYWQADGGNPTAFVINADQPVSANPPFVQPLPQWFPSLEFAQPWMDQAQPLVINWMDAFLNHYKNVIQGPAPARFHFDSEIYLSSCCDINFTRSLERATQDPRWSTTSDAGRAARQSK